MFFDLKNLLPKIYAPLCSLQQYSRLARHGDNQDVFNRGLDKDDVVHIYYGTLLSHKKEENVTLCNSMDGPGEHYAN